MNEPEPVIPSDLITPIEAAALLNTSAGTIRRWCRGKLPAFKLGGRLRVSRADVLAMLRRVETPGPTIPTRAELEARAKRTDEILRRARVRK
jgi:excisionase family DNA binding protein